MEGWQGEKVQGQWAYSTFGIKHRRAAVLTLNSQHRQAGILNWTTSCNSSHLLVYPPKLHTHTHTHTHTAHLLPSVDDILCVDQSTIGGRPRHRVVARWGMGVPLGTCLLVGLAQDDSTEQKAPNTHTHTPHEITHTHHMNTHTHTT